MEKWNNNNLACVDTWMALFRLKQIRTPFKDSGNIKMADLVYYNPVSGSEHRKMEATQLATTMDTVFTIGMGAALEEGVSKSQALNDMIKTLLDGDKTIAGLAKVNDKNYLFWKENE